MGCTVQSPLRDGGAFLCTVARRQKQHLLPLIPSAQIVLKLRTTRSATLLMQQMAGLVMSVLHTRGRGGNTTETRSVDSAGAAYDRSGWQVVWVFQDRCSTAVATAEQDAGADGAGLKEGRSGGAAVSEGHGGAAQVAYQLLFKTLFSPKVLLPASFC